MKGSVHDRARLVRDARGEKQPEFAQTLTRAARRLRLELRYDNVMVSRMENGTRQVTLDDAAVYATVDPEHRGLLWFAWGELGLEIERAATAARGARGTIPIDHGVPVEHAPADARRAGGADAAVSPPKRPSGRLGRHR